MYASKRGLASAGPLCHAGVATNREDGNMNENHYRIETTVPGRSVEVRELPAGTTESEAKSAARTADAMGRGRGAVVVLRRNRTAADR
jgi:hypothetical protein